MAWTHLGTTVSVRRIIRAGQHALKTSAVLAAIALALPGATAVAGPEAGTGTLSLQF